MSPFVRELLRPIIRENEGWELYIYTPRGKNHGYKLLKQAEKSPKWFSQVLTVRDTGIVSDEEIEEDRREGMTEQMVQQEYFCSFDAPVEGSYYGEMMTKADNDGRITKVPYETLLPVNTVWDLGMGDKTAIWFYQQHNTEIRLIDYYENCGEAIAHYIRVLKEKDYLYGRHYAPHDIEVRELFGSGRSRRQVARGLGVKFEVVKRQELGDGIEAVRTILSRCWFDEDKCEIGIECLKQYHKDFDEKLQVFRDNPVHDWSSHGADAFRYLALSLKETDKNKKKLPDKAESEYNPYSDY